MAPAAGSRYEVSPDGRTIRFDLRRDVHFHDGSPLTAEDVEFSFKVHRTDLYPDSNFRDDLAVFDRAEIVSPFAIRFHATKPLFSNLAVVGQIPIVPKALYSKKSEGARLNETVIGTGPYKLAEYHTGTRLILERNPEWWGRQVKLYAEQFNFARIIVRFIEEETLKLQMLAKGDLDYADLNLEAVLKRTSSKPWGESVFVEKANHRSSFTKQSSLFLNLRDPLFSSLKTRQALQYMINRDFINEKFFGGRSIPATGPWHRLGDYSDETLKPMEFNESQARALLKSDGWTDSNSDGVLDKQIDGKKVSFQFNFMFPVRDNEKILSIYQEDLKRVGIQMNLQHLDWTVFIKNLNDLNFQAFIIGRGWPGVIDFNPKSEWHSEFTNKGGSNAIGYKNVRVDDLLDQAELELDRGKRKTLVKKIYRLISKDQPQVFMFSDVEVYYARSARLKMKRPSYKYALGIEDWWIEPKP